MSIPKWKCLLVLYLITWSVTSSVGLTEQSVVTQRSFGFDEVPDTNGSIIAARHNPFIGDLQDNNTTVFETLDFSHLTD